jgi:eukaryotic-like serine/threonine-protein kinase
MKERLMQAAKETFYFVSSKIFLKNTTMALLLVTCLILLTFQGLKCYTNHGESVTVPNLKNQTINQIKPLLRKSSLQIQVVDSTYDPDKLPLTIMEQTPLSTAETGLKVKKHRTIYLTVNSVMPPKKLLPSIWDKDFRTAIRILENNGFRVIERERKPDKAVNTVLEVYYKGEELDRTKPNKLPENSKIEIVVAAEDGGTEVDVPDVVCLSYEEAVFSIESSNLTVLIVDKDGTVTDENKAYIWKQAPMPEPDLKLTVGEEVSVWLTDGLPPGCETEIDPFEEDINAAPRSRTTTKPTTKTGTTETKKTTTILKPKTTETPKKPAIPKPTTKPKNEDLEDDEGF